MMKKFLVPVVSAVLAMSASMSMAQVSNTNQEVVDVNARALPVVMIESVKYNGCLYLTDHGADTFDRVLNRVAKVKGFDVDIHYGDELDDSQVMQVFKRTDSRIAQTVPALVLDGDEYEVVPMKTALQKLKPINSISFTSKNKVGDAEKTAARNVLHKFRLSATDMTVDGDTITFTFKTT